jgi:lipid-A-disaccharide synthase-like uncharacterized protein
MSLEALLHVNAWVVVGLLGQALFASRFVVQWVASERRGRSVVPVVFWYLSLGGGLILFAYACFYRHDLVFTLGQSAGVVVYIRNLMLIQKHRRPGAGEPQGADAGA